VKSSFAPVGELKYIPLRISQHSGNRNRTDVRSIRQTGVGLCLCRSDSRTTQLHPWTLRIPSRWPASASNISFA
jgi:hypothetical protein